MTGRGGVSGSMGPGGLAVVGGGFVDPEGVEWVRAVRAVARVPGLSRSTLDSWVRRGRVRHRRVGRESWVAWTDVLEADGAAWLSGYRRGRRRGRRAADHSPTGQSFEAIAR